jgi:aminopeptidase N
MRFMILTILLVSSVSAQYKGELRKYTRADSLRGGLRLERTCYDVIHYHLDVTVDPDSQAVQGSNTITFKSLSASPRLQVDLFTNMAITGVTLDKKPANFAREANAVFVDLPALKIGSVHKLVVSYRGKPVVGSNPPWDGGLIWTKDAQGDPWVAVACQGKGASLWWPTKDHPADEPDSMMISVTVPPGLMNVSNGRLRKQSTVKNGWNRFDYAVTYPINNYNVTINVGKFVHFGDVLGGKDPLTLDYYVLREHLDKAKEQFKQTKPMIEAFEKYMGPYPFRRDGFKLVESPHLGMEHQSAVAYGNKYVNGYKGTSSSPEGVLFDFIIIHESGHEWWGNNVSSQDNADMWIHEGFCAYAEALYVEGVWGYDAAMRYMNGKKQQVSNTRPIIGVYGVNQSGSPDMYPKGALMLNTLRHALNNDSLWFAILKGIQKDYGLQTIHADSITAYVNRKSGQNWTGFFDQYLKHPKLPLLDVKVITKGKSVTLQHRWVSDAPEFRLPVRFRMAAGEWKWLDSGHEWGTASLGAVDPYTIEFDDRFYYELKKTLTWLDERLAD